MLGPNNLQAPFLRGRPVTADDFSKNHLNMVQKYRILGKKGEGSFAEVMACQNLADGQLYACKTLKRHFVSVDQALGLTEVRALRRLRPHVNVVQLHDIIFDKKSGRLALVFELMDLNMYELLKARKKPLPEFRVKNYMYQLVRSLDHIHRHGIFHRDVKPENLLIRIQSYELLSNSHYHCSIFRIPSIPPIPSHSHLLQEDNLLKLADFGSCRGINTKRPYTEYISTRWYRPPECLLTSGYYSYKMDMWAAGCVFFEALTNLPLFPGSSEIDQLSKIHNVLGTPKSPVIAKLRRHKRSNGVDFSFQPSTGIGISILTPSASPDALQLLQSLCSYDEEERPSARTALLSPYFLDLRLAEKYHQYGRHSSLHTGKRTSSESKQSSPLSPRSGHASRNSDMTDPSTRERKKHRSEQTLLLPTLEINGHGLRHELHGNRSPGIEILKCKTNRSVNLPPIAHKSRKKKEHRSHHVHVSHISQLPPIHQPWRP